MSGKTYPVRDKIEYAVMLISAFARRFDLSLAESYRYLADHKGIELCEKCYGALHTLSLEDGIEALVKYCKKNGGR